ncbi:MAG: hypothetical protein M1830_007116 [Pleopsidium flavum]|nr:MAG: hypothetical protein M1830_007116 [Pleopsidium flavum]
MAGHRGKKRAKGPRDPTQGQSIEAGPSNDPAFASASGATNTPLSAIDPVLLNTPVSADTTPASTAIPASNPALAGNSGSANYQASASKSTLTDNSADTAPGDHIQLGPSGTSDSGPSAASNPQAIPTPASVPKSDFGFTLPKGAPALQTLITEDQAKLREVVIRLEERRAKKKELFVAGKKFEAEKARLEAEFDDLLAKNLADWEEGQAEELDDLKDEIGILKIRLDKYEGPEVGPVVETLHTQFAELKERLKFQEMATNALEETVTQQSSTLEVQKNTIATLKKVQDDGEAIIAQFNKRHENTLRDQSKVVTELRQTISQLQVNLRYREIAGNGLQVTISQLEGMVSDREKVAEDLHNKCNQYELEKSNREADIAGLQNELARINKALANSEVQDNTDALKREIAELMTRLKEAEAQDATEALRSEIDELKMSIATSELMDITEILKYEIEELQTRVAEAESQDATKALEQEIVELKSKLTKAESQDTTQALQQEVNQLKTELTEARSKDATENLKQEIAQLQKRLTEAQAQDVAKDFQDEISRLKVKLDNAEKRDVGEALNDEILQLKAKLHYQEQNTDQEISHLKAELERETASREQDEEVYAGQGERVRKLSDEVAQHLASIKRAEDEVTRLTEEAKARDRTNRERKDTQRGLRGRVEAANEELNKTGQNLEDAREEIRRLKQKITILEGDITLLRMGQTEALQAVDLNHRYEAQLKSHDEDFQILQGNLQDLEEEITRLRSERRGTDGRTHQGEDPGWRALLDIPSGYDDLYDASDEDLPHRPLGGDQGIGRGKGKAPDKGKAKATDEGKGKATDEGKSKATDEGKSKATDKGKGKATDEGKGKTTDKGKGKATDEGEGKAGLKQLVVIGEEDQDDESDKDGENDDDDEPITLGTAPPIPGPGEPAEPIGSVTEMVEVTRMIYCPWLWWKFPYQDLRLLLAFTAFPLFTTVLWKIVAFHLFALNWCLSFYNKRIDLVIPQTRPRPRNLPPAKKVAILLLWHLIVYLSMGILLWKFSDAMHERSIWLGANELTRKTVISMRALALSSDGGNVFFRWTWRLTPKIARLIKFDLQQWLQVERGVYG